MAASKSQRNFYVVRKPSLISLLSATKYKIHVRSACAAWNTIDFPIPVRINTPPPPKHAPGHRSCLREPRSLPSAPSLSPPLPPPPSDGKQLYNNSHSRVVQASHHDQALAATHNGHASLARYPTVRDAKVDQRPARLSALPPRDAAVSLV